MQVRGKHTQQATIHSLFDDYYNMVDRMNQDYHMFFQHSTNKEANGWALHSALFYFFLTARALWEEHREDHALQVSRGSKQAAARVKEVDIPNFILGCAAALSPKAEH